MVNMSRWRLLQMPLQQILNTYTRALEEDDTAIPTHLWTHNLAAAWQREMIADYYQLVRAYYSAAGRRPAVKREGSPEEPSQGNEV